MPSASWQKEQTCAPSKTQATGRFLLCPLKKSRHVGLRNPISLLREPPRQTSIPTACRGPSSRVNQTRVSSDSVLHVVHVNPDMPDTKTNLREAPADVICVFLISGSPKNGGCRLGLLSNQRATAPKLVVLLLAFFQTHQGKPQRHANQPRLDWGQTFTAPKRMHSSPPLRSSEATSDVVLQRESLLKPKKTEKPSYHGWLRHPFCT